MNLVQENQSQDQSQDQGIDRVTQEMFFFTFWMDEQSTAETY